MAGHEKLLHLHCGEKRKRWNNTLWRWTREPPVPAVFCLIRRAISAPWPRKNLRRFIPGRDGWSTIPGRSGPLSLRWLRKPWPWWEPGRSRLEASASLTSGRLPSAGTRPPGSRCTMPSSGSAAGLPK